MIWRVRFLPQAIARGPSPVQYRIALADVTGRLPCNLLRHRDNSCRCSNGNTQLSYLVIIGEIKLLELKES